MHLLVDQNIPPQVADELVTLRYQASHVGRLGMARADDSEIIRYAEVHRMVLVTQDLGIALKMPQRHFGLITLRKVPVPQMATAISDMLQDLAAAGISLENAFITIEPGRYRLHAP
ncbi:MAG TPA: hypothetical protein ENI60_08345 [Candidatus Fraserbacteria bacterium]|nr:hypothetical protein [Candidatus Fraserbacteria bacterium]